MKKRMLLTAIILLLLSACANTNTSTQQPEEGEALQLPYAGVDFLMKDELLNAKASFQAAYGSELVQGDGVYIAGLTYCAIPRDKYEELVNKRQLSQEDTDYALPRLIEMAHVYAINNQRGKDELVSYFLTYGLDVSEAIEIGKEGEYTFYYLLDPLKNILDDVFIFDEGFREEYDSLLEVLKDPSWIRVYEPLSTTAGTAAGTRISFTTVDLDGNEVSSEDIFSKHQLTLVNIWGTYCGPCLAEMPDLQELSKILESRDCEIIGVVSDVYSIDDTAMVDLAREICSQLGVTYLNVLPWVSIDQDLKAPFIPTSYLIDRNGAIVGEPIVGARGAAEYEQIINNALASLE